MAASNRPLAADAPKNNVVILEHRPRRIGSQACVPCRTRRIKCGGGPAPCPACHGRQADDECIFDQVDGRRKEARKRKVDAADLRGELANKLITAIRMGDEADTLQLVQFIRSDVTTEQITFSVDQLLDRLNQSMQSPDAAGDDLLPATTTPAQATSSPSPAISPPVLAASIATKVITTSTGAIQEQPRKKVMRIPDLL